MKKYCVILIFVLIMALSLSACSNKATDNKGTEQSSSAVWSEMKKTGSMELQYATQFSVDYYEGGYSYISVADGYNYIVVPEGAAVPKGLPEGCCVLQQPLDRIYLCATSAMDLFRAIDGIDNIRLSGTKESGWYIQEAIDAMSSGKILYAGKYSAPDYELICSEKCDIAVESTMIYHSPAVKEKLEALEIPVFVERSSYEADPLGRMEWLKLYAVMLGKTEYGEKVFNEEIARLSDVLKQENTGKTIAFFSINTSGTVTVRKSGDYISRIIELAGGKYIFDDLGDDENALSTMNIQMETFYDGAKDADILIYNGTIAGELKTLEDLLTQSPLLADFKAYKSGDVWCAGQNLFQESMGLGQFILEINKLVNGASGSEGMQYLTKLN